MPPSLVPSTEDHISEQGELEEDVSVLGIIVVVADVDQTLWKFRSHEGQPLGDRLKVESLLHRGGRCHLIRDDYAASCAERPIIDTMGFLILGEHTATKVNDRRLLVAFDHIPVVGAAFDCCADQVRDLFLGDVDISGDGEHNVFLVSSNGIAELEPL